VTFAGGFASTEIDLFNDNITRINVK